ncbi:MAG: hypothetical protein K9L74_07550 [Candidatus Izimaplasma sp.]|nr:hypothetical protein [Candidatus Izimaplasma bacterium]
MTQINTQKNFLESKWLFLFLGVFGIDIIIFYYITKWLNLDNHYTLFFGLAILFSVLYFISFHLFKSYYEKNSCMSKKQLKPVLKGLFVLLGVSVLQLHFVFYLAVSNILTILLLLLTVILLVILGVLHYNKEIKLEVVGSVSMGVKTILIHVLLTKFYTFLFRLEIIETLLLSLVAILGFILISHVVKQTVFQFDPDSLVQVITLTLLVTVFIALSSGVFSTVTNLKSDFSRQNKYVRTRPIIQDYKQSDTTLLPYYTFVKLDDNFYVEQPNHFYVYDEDFTHEKIITKPAIEAKNEGTLFQFDETIYFVAESMIFRLIDDVFIHWHTAEEPLLYQTLFSIDNKLAYITDSGLYQEKMANSRLFEKDTTISPNTIIYQTTDELLYTNVNGEIEYLFSQIPYNTRITYDDYSNTIAYSNGHVVFLDDYKLYLTSVDDYLAGNNDKELLRVPGETHWSIVEFNYTKEGITVYAKEDETFHAIYTFDTETLNLNSHLVFANPHYDFEDGTYYFSDFNQGLLKLEMNQLSVLTMWKDYDEDTNTYNHYYLGNEVDTLFTTTGLYLGILQMISIVGIFILDPTKDKLEKTV